MNYEFGIRNSEFGIKDIAPNSAFRIPNYAQRRAGHTRSSPFARRAGCPRSCLFPLRGSGMILRNVIVRQRTERIF
ncbi:MAG: hypothetical protein LBQ66_04875 [Planctomycetaceae bacterium]|jgi:hypothetical protein|nr:hypothetical protein [Planctomycetaceae bacterium]